MKRILTMLMFSGAMLFSTSVYSQVTFNGNDNGGFGGVIGGSNMSWSDNGTTVTVTFTKGGGDFNDRFVIYISTGATGRTSIGTEVNDRGDALRSAITWMEASTEHSLNFPAGFQATHAIGIDRFFGGLWSIPATGSVGNNGLPFVKSVNSTLSSASQASFTFSFDVTDLGLTANSGATIQFLATYLNPFGGADDLGFASNEGYGAGFSGGNVGQASFTFTSSLSYSIRAQLTIQGSEGADAWRMLSSPKSGTTYGTFLSGLWTQGFTGASDGGANISESSVRVWSSSGFSAIGNITNEIPAGQGFIAVIYEDNDYETAGIQGGFPKTISLSGTENASGSAPVHGGWALAGNPFAATISHANLSFTGFNNVVYVYDHTYTPNPFVDPDQNAEDIEGGFRAFNGTSGGLTGGLIAPFQGFWVEADGGTSFNIAASAKSTSGNGTFFKSDAPSPVIQFAVRSEGRIGDAWLTFNEIADYQRDRSDAISLKPMDLKAHLMVSTLIEDGTPLNINNLPVNFEDVIEIPLVVERFEVESGVWVSSGGPAEMVWNLENLPDNWAVVLVDVNSGHIIDLLNSDNYEFELNRALAKARVETPLLSPQLASTNSSPRFLIRISDNTTTSTEIGTDLPVGVELSQNYPNPFNPATQIRFAVPVSGEVRLAVYDLLGREVAVLVKGGMSAGSHIVNFDAASLGSGVYVYRLDAAGQTLTRKMTLVK
jgi:hypothetical protein